MRECYIITNYDDYGNLFVNGKDRSYAMGKNHTDFPVYMRFVNGIFKGYSRINKPTIESAKEKMRYNELSYIEEYEFRFCEGYCFL